MRLQHKSLGVEVELLEDLKQRHVEAYFIALREIETPDPSTPQRLGNFVRAGCVSGILNSIHAEDVADLTPAAVAWLAQKLDAHIAKALTIPPE